MTDLKFEDGVKGLAIVGAVSYALGLIISNGFLAGLGVMDFELLRPRAIFTGLWFILFLSVGIVTEDSIQRAASLKEASALRRLWNALFAFCGGIIFYFISLTSARLWFGYYPSQIGSGQSASLSPRAVLWVSLVMFVSAGYAVVEGQNAVKEWRRRTTDQKMGPTSAPYFVGHCTVALLSLALFAYLFATNFYRYLPQQFGGGRTRLAQIAVSDKAVQVLTELSVTTNKGIIQGSVELLHDTSATVALRIDGGSTVILPRQEILAIRFK